MPPGGGAGGRGRGRLRRGGGGGADESGAAARGWPPRHSDESEREREGGHVGRRRAVAATQDRAPPARSCVPAARAGAGTTHVSCDAFAADVPTGSPLRLRAGVGGRQATRVARGGGLSVAR